MAITFDPVNKLIKITTPTTDITGQDLYNASMDWADELDNFIYDVPMDANGNFQLGIGVFSDVIYRLLSSWKIKWFDGDKTVAVRGTLITDDDTNRTVPADSGSIETLFQANTSGTIEHTDVALDSRVTDSTPLAGNFNGPTTLNVTDDFYNGSVLVFIDGTLKGIARKVTNYIGATRTFEFLGTGDATDAPFPVAPADSDPFRLIGRMV